MKPEKQKQKNLLKKQNKECQKCTDKVSLESIIFCEKHRLINKEFHRNYFKDNKEKIRDTINLKKNKNRNNNICINCINNSLIRSSYCKKCLLKYCAFNHLGLRTRYLELEEKLIQQDFKCYYTGYPISIEDGTASIDHIKPISKFPELKHNINNLVWCHISFNFAKNDRLEEEFVPYFYKVSKSFIKKQETIEQSVDSFDI